MKRVLIAGATGYLGRHLAQKFTDEDWIVRALVRDTARAKKSGLTAHELIEGKATEPSELVGKFDDIDLVISTLGITRQKDEVSYMDVDYQANINLLEEAMQAGVKRFCYVHVINADRMKQVALVAAKQKFVERLIASPIASTIVSPSGYFSDMGDFLSMAKSGRVYLFGKGEKKLNPIGGADLAIAIHECVNKGRSEMLVGGPDIYTQTEIAQLAFAVLGNPVRITYLPEFLIKFAVWALTTFTPQSIYGPFQFFLTALQLDMVGERHGGLHLREHFAKLVHQTQ